MIFKISRDIKFSNFYKRMNIFSLILIFLSVLFLFIKGLNFGVDFKGGTLIEARAEGAKFCKSQKSEALQGTRYKIYYILRNEEKYIIFCEDKIFLRQLYKLR